MQKSVEGTHNVAGMLKGRWFDEGVVQREDGKAQCNRRNEKESNHEAADLGAVLLDGINHIGVVSVTVSPF